MSTFYYNWSFRFLLLFAFLIISLNIAEPFINVTIQKLDLWDKFLYTFNSCSLGLRAYDSYDSLFYMEPDAKRLDGNLLKYYDDVTSNIVEPNYFCYCTKDLDYTFRVMIKVWSILLLILILLKMGRDKKLTLQRSCAQVALRYGYEHYKLIELCEKHNYKYFPTLSLEAYIQHLEHPVTTRDIDEFIDILNEEEQDHITNRRQFEEIKSAALSAYEDKLNEAKSLYEHGNQKNVLLRRNSDKWTYEQYLEFEMELNPTHHTVNNNP